MAKKDQDEYQFPEEEYEEEEQAQDEGLQPTMETDQEPQGLSNRLKDRRIIIPIVLVLAVFIVYFFLGRDDEPQRKIESTPQIQATPTQVSASVQNQLDTFRRQLTSQDSEINAISNSNQQMREAIVQLNQSVVMLQKSTQELADEIADLKRRPVAQAKKTVIYHVKAIVQGRAWLQTPDGIVTSVKVGDQLKGYGTVEEIKPAAGVVETSSGDVIHFAVGDS